MPIYAYRCESCGFAEDVLRKMSDPLLTDCPECSESTFRKQVTAAGFQLKGSGWYVTDFREGGSHAATGKPATDSKVASKEASSDAPAGGSASGNDANSTNAATSAAPAGAPAASGSAAGSASNTPAASTSSASGGTGNAGA
jgi:putative FmdB family regulatory protein